MSVLKDSCREAAASAGIKPRFSIAPSVGFSFIKAKNTRFFLRNKHFLCWRFPVI